MTASNDELSTVKRQLRRWESSFLERHGRPPTKDDLTPLTDITALYNQYAQLKRRSSSSSSSPCSHSSQSPDQSPAKQAPPSHARSLSSVLHGSHAITRSSSISSRPAVHRTKSSTEFGYRPISSKATDSPTKQPSAQSVIPAGSDDDTMHAEFMRDVQRERQAQLTRSDTNVALHMVVPSAHHTLKRTVSDAILHTSQSSAPPSSDVSTPLLSTYVLPPAEPSKLSLSPSSAVCIVQRTSSLSKRVSALPVSQPSAPRTIQSDSSAQMAVANDTDDERPLNERMRRRGRIEQAGEGVISDTDTQQPKQTTTRRRKRATAQVTAQPIGKTHATDETKLPEESDAHPPSQQNKKPKRSTSRKRRGEPDGVEVSHNYVRMNLKRKTKAYSRHGQSANSLRQQKYRERRGWKTKAEWKRVNAQRSKSVQDALYIELVDPAVVHRLTPSCTSGRVSGGGGYETDDDLAALAALEEGEKRQCESIARRDAASLDSADLQALLHHHFGFASFRPFQLECITHILSSPSSSSLLILPTAAGKSLCYLLPALVLPFTLVVSPLLSLMSDQCRHLPPALKGSYWSSASTFEDSKQIMKDIRCGTLRLLFVSPEKALSPSFTSFLASLPSPPSLLVVDEAHCISHWSHNFRPSYLRLGALRERCERVLLMTGTATREREEEMRSMMAGSDHREVRVMREGRRRDELKVRMVKVNEDDKERQLLAWIKEWKEREKQRGYVGRGAIVYVNTREQADRYAAFLTSHNYRAAAYHAGLNSAVRSRVQSSFLSTAASSSSFTLTPCPIVVATIAFGMGIDKSDVGLVLHTYVPSCLEMYAQEIGRAGRDGRESDVWCCWSGEDEVRARSWVWRDGVERGRVRVLLRKVMDDAGLPAEGQLARTRQQRSVRESAGGEFVALNVGALQQQLNLTAEVAVTLLSHLQLSAESPCLHIVNTQHDTAHVTFRRPLQEMQQLAASAPLVTHALSCPSPSASSDTSPTFELSLCEASNRLGQTVVEVQRELLRLRALGECTIKWEHESVILRVSAVTRDRAEGSDGDETVREVHVSLIMDKQRQHEERNQQAVELMIAAMHATAAEQQQLNMHELMEHYFDQQRPNNTQLLLDQLKQRRADSGSSSVAPAADWSALDASVGSLLSSEAEKQLGVQSLAAKGIALVLHGLHTLSTPAQVWGNSRWWGKWKHVSFTDVEQRAEAVVTSRREQARTERS